MKGLCIDYGTKDIKLFNLKFMHLIYGEHPTGSFIVDKRGALELLPCNTINSIQTCHLIKLCFDFGGANKRDAVLYNFLEGYIPYCKNRIYINGSWLGVK